MTDFAPSAQTPLQTASAATAAVRRLGRFEFLDGSEVTPADPTLAALKAGHYYSSQGPVIHEVSLSGSELSVVSSPVDTIVVVCGHSRTVGRIGRAITQSRQGEFLGHVVNISDVDPSVRGYQYGGGQNMHSDSCDIIGLMCLRAARSGGASRIVSAVAIHDELARLRPDLLRLHYWGFTYRRNELDARLGSGVIVPPVPIATFARRDGELSCYLGTNYALRAAEAGDSVLSAAQREAIEIVQQIATSPEFYLDMQIGEGDIQFLNNRLIFHGRTAYEDHQDVALRRHMLRLWLCIDQWPALPANQRPHSDEDHRLWLRQRRAFMEFPSRFFADLARRRSA